MEDNSQIRLIAAIISILLSLLIGTTIYSSIEGWSTIDSFYFTGMTLTTVGYGDLHPTHDSSKIITVIFSFFGVGVVLFALSTIASDYFERREEYFLRKIHDSYTKKFVNHLPSSHIPAKISEEKKQ